MKGRSIVGGARDFNVDFFCIGAPKCGSTWLARCLGEHPQIGVAKIKEPNFFVRTIDLYRGRPNETYLRSWEWYKGLFPPGKKRGDFSINMLMGGRETAALVNTYFPATNFIVTLRDPVARAYSHYWFDRAASEYDAETAAAFPKSFEAALANSRLRESGKYFEQLSAWLEVFPPEAFHVVIDSDIRRDAMAVVQGIFRFLEVSGDFVPSSLHQRVNAAFDNRPVYVMYRRWTGRLRRAGLTRVLDTVNRLGLGMLAEKVGQRSRVNPPIDPATAGDLRRYYREDVEKLEGLLGRDLAEWKTGRRVGG